MLKRKVEQAFTAWKNNPSHSPLVVKGPRQCGKTFSVVDFAQKNYKNVHYLNFYEHKELSSVFSSGSLTVDTIIMNLSALFGPSAKFEPHITELPLDGNAMKDVFKIYMADTGLFVAMLEDGTQHDILNGNLYGYKGAIFENLIADIFGKMGRKLYYFHKESGLEIDFVIRYKGECVPIEVKASTGNTKSTKTLLAHPEKYHVSRAIKFGNYNVGMSGAILTLPTYMAFMLQRDMI